MFYNKIYNKLNIYFLNFFLITILVQFGLISYGQVTYISQSGSGTLSGTSITINKPNEDFLANLFYFYYCDSFIIELISFRKLRTICLN